MDAIGGTADAATLWTNTAAIWLDAHVQRRLRPRLLPSRHRHPGRQPLGADQRPAVDLPTHLLMEEVRVVQAEAPAVPALVLVSLK